MSFSVTLDKQSYLPREPIYATFQFSNRTNSSLRVREPNFLGESGIMFATEEGAKEISTLSIIGNPGIRFSGRFAPGHTITKEEMLGLHVVGHFSQAGIYDLEFFLRDSTGSKLIKAPRIKVEIRHAEGVHKEALDFMNEHEDFFGLSSWTILNDTHQNLLETFVSRFGGSVYGELAVSSLGSFYLANGKFDEAQALFQKLRNSPHRTMSDDAVRNLKDIDRKKLELKRSISETRVNPKNQ